MILATLEQLAARFDDTTARRRPAAGGFSLVEHVWHLADLEREGFGERIRRLRTEDDPQLPDFDGERAARERNYQALGLAEGLAAFRSAREANLRALAALAPAELHRSGTQEGVGCVTLGEMAARMEAHDRAHLAELTALVRELAQS